MNYFRIVADDSSDLLTLPKANSTLEFDSDLCRLLTSGKSLIDSWAPFSMEVTSDDGIPKDFASTTLLGAFLVSPAAWECMQSLIKNDAEALPIQVTEGREYLAVNILSIVDALDYSKAQLRYSKQGPNSPENVMAINLFAFKKGALTEQHLFRLPEGRFDHPIVTETLKEHIEKSGLTAARFTPLPMAS